ncbi:SDR family NAD(P)-dependent oxidoreductase [Aquabacter spiritensis]|uniref:NAD(P)-dependent dehydrogenase (Short-subunit alcohol dehydrogenase family) n=1 Tax=Aquabacter spiritensis TaxID=933073 RepID=A0A4V6NZM0_9HYPH|nr:SDR family NAD(P)-dependent oxidoreductase [Aquabacter spiritensis]TCT07678.1 NAD(P)-dependent dehydrogenase (short-subunit alcohol dehydrogenase family) [Aquabacter spiritensis]
MDLDGRTAIVTGGAQGIGLACVDALIAAGARVALLDRNRAGAEAAAHDRGAHVVPLVCDVSDPAQVTAAVQAAETALGPVSILVNNAGMTLSGDVLSLDYAAFQAVLAVNLGGTFLMTQAVARRMVALEIPGSIVNLSSVNAVLAIPGITAYCASKGGVGQLTKASALALAPHRIRVNAVGPGSIMTDMMRGVASDETAMRRVLSRTPLGRIGEPREVADVVVFLASDKASYITGETIFIDGGRSGLNYTV